MPAAQSESTDTEASAAIVCAGLSKRYGNVAALTDLELAVPRGATFGVLGPNGAGKSTLIRLLLGLVRPSAGTVAVLGERRIERVRPRVGYLPERPHYDGLFSAREYLQSIGGLHGLAGAALARRVDELLALCGLSEAADRRLRTYSKGMLQRAGVAQALVGEPELLILDEPSSGLDPSGQWEVRQLIQRVRERGCTILLCSHALAEVQHLCSHACILRGGRLAWSGALDAATLGQPRVRIEFAAADDRVRALLDGLPALVWHERAVEVRADDQAEALRRLIAADVPIQALNPLRPSFEQIYLQATAATVDATRDGSPA